MTDRAPTEPHSHDWDEHYRQADQVWSGAPNDALVAEASGLPPGRALDIGCGEGADAIWLARRGWQVTAVDPSTVALERARRAAETDGVAVTWILGHLHELDLPPGEFDLVSVAYVPMERPQDPVARLAALVAPGGSLLVVHHADLDPERIRAHGHDPEEWMGPEQVAADLPSGWVVATNARRDRHVASGAGAEHREDIIVRAVRPA